MLSVGLTGGIASGKSVALARFADLGASAVDHDRLAREAVAPGSVGLARVVAEFGEDVLTDTGELDRSALANIIFRDERSRERLNNIIHPEVRRRAAEEEARAAAGDPVAVVVHDIPLLIETRQTAEFAVVVVVDAPREIRIARLVDERGMSEADATSRIAAQSDDDTRRAAADIVLDGSGSPDSLRSQVDELWPRLAHEALVAEGIAP